VSTTALVWVPQATAPPEPVDPRLIRLKQRVLDIASMTESQAISVYLSCARSRESSCLTTVSATQSQERASR
jgi:hypothetical protein